MVGRRLLALLVVGGPVLCAGLMVRFLIGRIEPVSDDSVRVLRQFLVIGVTVVALFVEYLVANWMYQRRHPHQTLYEWIRRSFTS